MRTKNTKARRTLAVVLSLMLLLTSFVFAVPASAYTSPHTMRDATDYALVRQASVAGGYYRIDQTLKINNVHSGVKADYGYAGLSDVSVVSPVYIKSYQAQIGNYTGISATLYVDPAHYSNVLNTGLNLQLYMANVTACSGNNVRWGVQLYGFSNGSQVGTLANGHDSVTVTSDKGNSFTYTLTNAAGTAISGCETGGNWTADITNTPETAYGPYTWYLSGPTPAAGETVKVRVVAITVAKAANNNYQMHSEWIDLIIVGYQPCTHSQSWTAHGSGSSLYYTCDTCGERMNSE